MYSVDASNVSIIFALAASAYEVRDTPLLSAGIPDSITCRPAGSIAPPVKLRTLKPLSYGGLWLAVMLMAPSAFCAFTANAITGVGVAPLVRYTFTPWPASTSAAAAAKSSD